jgi:lipoprotein-anchoring transpeptidase ErfK/SrfK
MKQSLLRIAAVTMCAAAFTTGPAVNTPASAQFSSFFSFSSASGRSMVSFPKRYGRGTIIVSFGDRRLYHVQGSGRAMSYPIAVPRREARWGGTLRVSQKKVNPGWTPTARMRREDPSLPAHVPGGHPRNPLGNRALYLGSTLYRIHGTDAPQLIGREVSSGCIRMHNAHVKELYNRTRVGARVIVTSRRYSTAAVASTPSSRPSSSSTGSSSRFGTGGFGAFER